MTDLGSMSVVLYLLGLDNLLVHRRKPSNVLSPLVGQPLPTSASILHYVLSEHHSAVARMNSKRRGD